MDRNSTARVRMVRDHKHYRRGQTYTLPSAKAAKLVARGIAVSAFVGPSEFK